MKPTAIVYTSNLGHTRQYALLLSKQLGLPVYSLEEANSKRSGGPVIYLGWIHASHVKGYGKAAKRFPICAVCAVGLCDTGTLTAEVRKATAIPTDIPLFTLQGGMDRGRLKGMDKLLISMLTKGAFQTRSSAPCKRNECWSCCAGMKAMSARKTLPMFCNGAGKSSEKSSQEAILMISVF